MKGLCHVKVEKIIFLFIIMASYHLSPHCSSESVPSPIVFLSSLLDLTLRSTKTQIFVVVVVFFSSHPLPTPITGAYIAGIFCKCLTALPQRLSGSFASGVNLRAVARV